MKQILFSLILTLTCFVAMAQTPQPNIISITPYGAIDSATRLYTYTNKAWRPIPLSQIATFIGAGGGSTSGVAGGSLTGTYPNPTLAANSVASANILTGAVTNVKLADGSVTTVKLDVGAVTTVKVADGAVTEIKLANGSVTPAKLSTAGMLNGQVLRYNSALGIWEAVTLSTSPTGAAGGALVGTYPNPTLNVNSVSTNAIVDGAVTTVDLADGSVTGAKIAINTIGTGNIADMAITRTKVDNLAIDDTKLADGAVTDMKLDDMGALDGQVLTYNTALSRWTPTTAIGGAVGVAGGMLSGTYPNPSIAVNSITSGYIVDGAITTSKILDGAVTSTSIANGTIEGIDIATSTIDNSKMTINSITTDNIVNGTIKSEDVMPMGLEVDRLFPAMATAGQVPTYNGATVVWANPAVTGAAGGSLTGTYPNPTIANDAITNLMMADNSVTETEIVDGAISTDKIVADAIYSGHIADGTILAADLSTNIISTPYIVDGAVTALKLDDMGAANRQVLTYNGTTSQWQPISALENDALVIKGIGSKTVTVATNSVVIPIVNGGVVPTTADASHFTLVYVPLSGGGSIQYTLIPSVDFTVSSISGANVSFLLGSNTFVGDVFYFQYH